jgi:TonB-linked SusC/RagA family outer membrane protein
MKLITLLLTLSLVNLSASVYSQNVKLSIDVEGKPVKEILKVLESQSEFRFLYNEEFLGLDRPVTISMKDSHVEDVLDKLFDNHELTYRVFDNLIVITPSSITLKQTFKVLGTITDEVNNEPLAGVNVIVEGTTIGVISDAEGRYTIELSNSNAALSFSFVGYISQRIQVAGQSTINVKLTPDVTSLEEIVVVGYGTVRKSDISGAVASVNTEDMIKKAPTNILQGLQGAAAGVIVTAQDGAPDANAAIRIRGVATINGSANPLYVVDGVQVGSNANFLAPSDIASIEVLKDASATAIYGSAGANGVIMITTKHGIAGKARITFSADYGLQTLASKLDVGDIDQFAKNVRTGRANDGANLMNQVFSPAYDSKRKNIDWQDVMTRTSLKQQYNLSASGGTEKTQSNLSLGYFNNDGIIINSNYNRLNARANVITKVADFIEIGGDISFVHTETQGSNASFGNNGNLSSLRDLAFYCPTLDYVTPDGVYVSPNVVNANGTYGASYQTTTGYDGGSPDNLYATQMENNGLTKRNQLLASTYASIKLFKGLTFKTIASYNLYMGNFENFWGNKKRYEPDGITPVSLISYDTRYRLQIDNSQSNNIALENYLTYNWKNDLHNLTLMAGNSVSKSFGSWTSASATDFPGENIRDIGLTSDKTTRTGSGAYNLQVRGLSYFGRAIYTLKDRYILTGTLRRDGSSNFGADNRWGAFPSAALAWRISEENFLQGIPAISNLKLRFGWGQTGNSGGATDKSVAALTSNTIAYYYYAQNGVAGFGSTRQTANGSAIPLVDTRLKWETNEQNNIGIDLGLFNNKLNITLDYFTRTSKDLLLYQSIRPSAGYKDVYTNFGEIQNKGVEFSIDFKKNINQDWNIGASLTGSSLQNKVIQMGADLLNVNDASTNDGSNVGAVQAASGSYWNGHSICREGYAVGSFYGYKVEGVFQSKEEVDAANVAAKAAGHAQYQDPQTSTGDFKYKDINGDGFIDEKDMTILGNGFPKVNFGLNLNASYKHWDLSVYTYGVMGQKIYSYSAMTLSTLFATDNGTVPNILSSAASEAWTPENKSTTLSKLTILDPNKNRRGSDAWVKKGDFFKISTVQLGYNFDKRLLTPLHLESVRLYVSVQNLACFSSYNKYGDPETGHGSVLYTGLDTGRYPMPRIYSFGFNIQF